ncbi:hypothetical protein CROQUDRAFT_53977 [Cronartium quercuum f. sp. fusiforme G11]|uniref:Uncharacterized protein n=1 Tax=Cronartium quercuum f. sp. fusiforme G11 TaxID=708437 RepID=A0A9P6N9K4_9BASI|nr:hypothetical protein CROQUDRAFT_53977 [Cronartium quercuum f. sp. fusiforme G11]
MSYLDPTNNPEAIGMVLCTCSECIKSEHTDASGKQVKGLWIYHGTRRHHMNRKSDGSKELSMLKALSENFCTKAHIKDADPAINACSEPDDMDSTSDHNLVKLVCKFLFHFNII